GPVEVVAVTLYDSFDGQQPQQQPPGSQPGQGGPASGSGSSPSPASTKSGGGGGSAPTTPQGTAHRSNNGCAPGLVSAVPQQQTQQPPGFGNMPLKELKEPKDCE
ncbi:hypothetical protein IscW_ISCW020423, partial [Ixodes scapularis]